MLQRYQNKLIYCDAKPEYRDPIGPVPTGGKLRLFLRCCAPGVRSCTLLTWPQGESGPDHPMEAVPGGFAVNWQAPWEAQVIFYRFRADTPDGPVYIGRGAGPFYGELCLEPEALPAFQLTVWNSDFTTPDWCSGGVMYQIFPDRFARGEAAQVESGLAYHRALGREMRFHASWQEPVEWEGHDGNPYYPNDFYGGTLRAITEKLEYLQRLGVTILYLNPVFESDSNHRYNTADYHKIDPILGTEADLRELCTQAQARGIRVILDGVFSHTGADSRYFNQRNCYPGPGAVQSQDSPYYSWYTFTRWPAEYKSWWGFPSLPEVRETDPAWQREIITGENSVIRAWLRCGISGYRLDVADELPDEVLELIHTAARETRPDALILGEVWEDATTKVSYGVRRRYCLGTSLDSVMNYPLRRGVLDFLLGYLDSTALLQLLLGQRLHYPPPIYRCLMNLLSSHDVDRALTVLSTRIEGDKLTRRQRAEFCITAAQAERGRQSMELATTLLWSLPGVPSIYYGEEAGLQGFGDPFVRAPMNWDSDFLQAHYALLGRLRREHIALREGAVALAAPDPACLCVLRQSGAETILTVVCRGETSCVLDLRDFYGDPIETAGLAHAQPLLGEGRGFSFSRELIGMHLTPGCREMYLLER